MFTHSGHQIFEGLVIGSGVPGRQPRAGRSRRPPGKIDHPKTAFGSQSTPEFVDEDGVLRRWCSGIMRVAVPGV